jgi:hypothetical protein
MSIKQIIMPLSATATGLTFTTSTGVLSLTSGYVIPTTTEQSNWNTAYGWGNHASAGYLTSVTAHNLLSATHGDTLAGNPILGDVLIGNTTPAWARLAGQITTTRKFLRQTGTSTISALPAWDTILDADIPSYATWNAKADYSFGANNFSGSGSISAGDITGTSLIFTNGTVLSNPSANTYRCLGTTTGGYVKGFEIDFATNTNGPVLSGTTTQDAVKRLYINGYLILLDDQIMTFGTSADTTLRWYSAPSFDGILWTINSGGGANGGGNITVTDTITRPTLTDCFANVGHPAIRLQARDTTASHYIQFNHNGTNAVVDAGFGLLLLNPTGNSAVNGSLSVGKATAPTVPLDVVGAILSSTTITATTGFGCNSKAAQTAYTVNAACDLTTVVALTNQIRAALIADGICV